MLLSNHGDIHTWTFYQFRKLLSQNFPHALSKTVKGHPLSQEPTSCFLGCVQIRFLLRLTDVLLIAYPLISEPIGHLIANKTKIRAHFNLLKDSHV